MNAADRRTTPRPSPTSDRPTPPPRPERRDARAARNVGLLTTGLVVGALAVAWAIDRSSP